MPPRDAASAAPEAQEALAVPDEHDLPADPGDAHDLERDRVVRRPQQPDRERAHDDGGRDEAGS